MGSRAKLYEIPDAGGDVFRYTLKPALCCDLDGTIRRSTTGDFIESVEGQELFEGIEEKLWAFRDVGFAVIGVTNQGGVAHGFRTVNHLEAELDYFVGLFDISPFHEVFYAVRDPQGSVAPFNTRSLLRKPLTGMLAIAEFELFDVRQWVIDWDRSLFVGDRGEDRQCAEAAGIHFVWAHWLRSHDPSDILRRIDGQ